MNSSWRTNDLSELYAPEKLVDREQTDPTSQALGYLVDAWEALEKLEASLPQELARWDAESLTTARKGTRRAWLALSNLSRSLNTKRSHKDGERS
jgi:hypothetical protein